MNTQTAQQEADNCHCGLVFAVEIFAGYGAVLLTVCRGRSYGRRLGIVYGSAALLANVSAGHELSSAVLAESSAASYLNAAVCTKFLVVVEHSSAVFAIHKKYLSKIDYDILVCYANAIVT